MFPTPKELAEYMMELHRKLQQDSMRLFMWTFEEWARAYDAGRYDRRNEATCRMAKKIVEMVRKEGLVLPLIWGTAKRKEESQHGFGKV